MILKHGCKNKTGRHLQRSLMFHREPAKTGAPTDHTQHHKPFHAHHRCQLVQPRTHVRKHHLTHFSCENASQEKSVTVTHKKSICNTNQIYRNNIFRDCKICLYLNVRVMCGHVILTSSFDHSKHFTLQPLADLFGATPY